MRDVQPRAPRPEEAVRMPVDWDSSMEKNVHFLVEEKLTSEVKTKSDSSKYRVNYKLFISS